MLPDRAAVRSAAGRLRPTDTALRVGWFSLLGWAVYVALHVVLTVVEFVRMGATAGEWQQYFLQDVGNTFGGPRFYVMFATPLAVVLLAHGGYLRRLYDAVVVTAVATAGVTIPGEVVTEIEQAATAGTPLSLGHVGRQLLDDGLIDGLLIGGFFGIEVAVPFVVTLWLADRYWPGVATVAHEPTADRTQNNPDVTPLPDGGTTISDLSETDADRLLRIQEDAATANQKAAAAVANATNLSSPPVLPSHLEDVHGALLDTYQETVQSIDQIEHALDDADSYGRGPTPRQLKSDHADRLKEQYDGPVRTIALQLLEWNRRKWLHRKPETNGAEAVERHGLTGNQRGWLNELRAAWEDYDGGE